MDTVLVIIAKQYQQLVDIDIENLSKYYKIATIFLSSESSNDNLTLEQKKELNNYGIVLKISLDESNKSEEYIDTIVRFPILYSQANKYIYINIFNKDLISLQRIQNYDYTLDNFKDNHTNKIINCEYMVGVHKQTLLVLGFDKLYNCVKEIYDSSLSSGSSENRGEIENHVLLSQAMNNTKVPFDIAILALKEFSNLDKVKSVFSNPQENINKYINTVETDYETIMLDTIPEDKHCFFTKTLPEYFSELPNHGTVVIYGTNRKYDKYYTDNIKVLKTILINTNYRFTILIKNNG